MIEIILVAFGMFILTLVTILFTIITVVQSIQQDIMWLKTKVSDVQDKVKELEVRND